MENTQEFKIENKHLRALSCIFFLGPIVPMALKRGNYKLKDSDFDFIKSYVKYGTFLDIAFLVYMILSIYTYMNYSEFMYYITNIVLFGVIGGIFFGIFLVFQSRNFESIHAEITYTKIKPGNINIIFYFTPIYNLILWYQEQKDMKAYRWIKESIIILSFFVISNFLSQLINDSFATLINVVFIGGYVFRLISLVGGADVITDQTKEKLDKLFDNNPEELWGYLKGAIIYIYKKYKAKNLELDINIQQQIQNEKKDFQKIYLLQNESGKTNNFLITQYIILTLLAIGYGYYNYRRISFDIYGLIYLLPGVLFIGRYIIMYKYKRLPNLPVIYEFTNMIWKTFKFLK